MKKIIAFLTIASLLSFKAKDSSYNLDTKASTVHWLGKKATGQHDGNVTLKSGKVSTDGTSPLVGEFVLDMTTITVADIANAKTNASLVGHLKAEDFFGVEANPTATLTAKRFIKLEGAKAGEANYKVIADLTIKGITNPIEFPATVTITADKLTANATITIDRTKWKVVYKSKSIFDTLGDKFIYDDIEFTVNLVLNK